MCLYVIFHLTALYKQGLFCFLVPFIIAELEKRSEIIIIIIKINYQNNEFGISC